jgi:cystathionine beta-synthase
MKVQPNILSLIGNTPLIRLEKIVAGFDGNFFTKLEAFNPGHSNKDRIALHIIQEAEKNGILSRGDTIIETTSGNTGFSLAMVSLIKGYKCILAVSSKSSNDKIDMLHAMGAKVYVCPANVSAEDPRSYYQVAKKLHSEIKGSVYINQYFNDLNIEAHYKSTGPEIWNQTEGKITHLVASSGTGGTISGCAKYLKEQNPAIEIIGVDAYGSVLKKYHETRELDTNEIYPYRIEGLGKNLIPSATDFDSIDTFVKVTDEDSAHTAREITRSEGLFVGYTSGAAMQAVKQLNQVSHFNKYSVVVIIFPDHGSRYMSKIYSDKWMIEQGFFDITNEEVLNKIEYI